MGTSFGNVLTPLWFKYVKILSFTTCVRWKRGLGLDACSGMVGCLRWTSWGIGPLDLVPLLLMSLKVVWAATLVRT